MSKVMNSHLADLAPVAPVQIEISKEVLNFILNQYWQRLRSEIKETAHINILKLHTIKTSYQLKYETITEITFKADKKELQSTIEAYADEVLMGDIPLWFFKHTKGGGKVIGVIKDNIVLERLIMKEIKKADVENCEVVIQGDVKAGELIFTISFTILKGDDDE